MARSPILARPVLRRVERNRVVAWIALQAEATVRLKVWPGIHAASAVNLGEIDGDDPHPIRQTSSPTLRFGAKLHVAPLDLKLGDLGEHDPPNGPFQPVVDPGTVYSYHLRITPAVGEPTDLLGTKLLQSRPPDPGGDQIYADETPGPASRPSTRNRGRPP